MIVAKFSTKYDAVIQRIKRLPKMLDYMANSVIKKDAIGIIETLQDGIRNNSFNLIALKDATIYNKRMMGYPKPNTPLYGLGDEVVNSYINTMRIRKLKNGYKVFPSWAKHHTSSLTLRDLFKIHSEGALIKQGTTIIRIPPRPTFRKAFNRYLRHKARKENVQLVKKAINIYIKTGSGSKINDLIKSVKRKDFDET